ncbi:unnamed protein product [Didymodactylos carnosus]|uniref:ADP-ribosylhydrolase ARH3 n=1 Tax=Didymodactylos carnosus TaxID=1234261 RepID=A0A815GPJ3_9BILA|nr:unnamed protein product [Didymodactylos carnosus]CAF1342844.1 unnamed protein product [Didymodactylos carnosus]CAF4063392.1 unnamed protein product [Didymodactylos carnosus]CAF4205437.1 unnamed protein product [Didymodactylos carnosus]
MPLTTDEIMNRALGLVLGVAVGDAKGIGYELLTRQQILELKQTREKENESTDEKEMLYPHVTTSNPYIPHDWPCGRWTDDTQLTLAMVRAISKSIETKTPLFSNEGMSYIVEEHITEWKECVHGWGGTKTAIENLNNKSHTYKNSGNTTSVGNGVLMKIAPLAFYYYILDEKTPVERLERDDEIEILCRMTHNTTVAVMSACVFVKMSIYAFKHSLSSHAERLSFLDYASQVAIHYEHKYGLDIDKDVKNILSTRIKRYIQELKQTDSISEETLISVSNGGTFFCVDSLSMVIGLLACQVPSFDTVVRATEIGGDTDSNAAMIGALVGGMKGQKEIDEHHVKYLYRTDYVRQVGEEFGAKLVDFYEK